TTGAVSRPTDISRLLSIPRSPRRPPTLSLPDALPICVEPHVPVRAIEGIDALRGETGADQPRRRRLRKAEREAAIVPAAAHAEPDRKSTRLNSSHVKISYAVFCLKKKKHTHTRGAEEQ